MQPSREEVLQYIRDQIGTDDRIDWVELLKKKFEVRPFCLTCKTVLDLVGDQGPESFITKDGDVDFSEFSCCCYYLEQRKIIESVDAENMTLIWRTELDILTGEEIKQVFDCTQCQLRFDCLDTPDHCWELDKFRLSTT